MQNSQYILHTIVYFQKQKNKKGGWIKSETQNLKMPQITVLTLPWSSKGCLGG